jgi:hypothetical protein
MSQLISEFKVWRDYYVRVLESPRPGPGQLPQELQIGDLVLPEGTSYYIYRTFAGRLRSETYVEFDVSGLKVKILPDQVKTAKSPTGKGGRATGRSLVAKVADL